MLDIEDFVACIREILIYGLIFLLSRCPSSSLLRLVNFPRNSFKICLSFVFNSCIGWLIAVDSEKPPLQFLWRTWCAPGTLFASSSVWHCSSRANVFMNLRKILFDSPVWIGSSTRLRLTLVYFLSESGSFSVRILLLEYYVYGVCLKLWCLETFLFVADYILKLEWCSSVSFKIVVSLMVHPMIEVSM